MDISALQQELMVAALSCGGNARTEFNDFQLNWKNTLQHSDSQMLSAFEGILGSKGGHKAYHTFKTKLATNAELKRIDNVPAYCAAAHYKALALNALIRALQSAPPDAETRRTSLRSFAVAAEQPDFVWPITACATATQVTTAEETGAAVPPGNATAVSTPHQK